MNSYKAGESAIIDAPAKRVYGIISDYHEGHPAILPSRYFSEMHVTEGGRGDGTVATVKMNVFGNTLHFHMTVSEPEPGRILREEDAAAGAVILFTVDPVNGGDQSRVTIVTTARTSPGLRGLMEKLFTPAILRRIYREELAQLAAVVQKED